MNVSFDGEIQCSNKDDVNNLKSVLFFSSELKKKVYLFQTILTLVQVYVHTYEAAFVGHSAMLAGMQAVRVSHR